MAVLLLVVFLTIFISAQCSLYETTLEDLLEVVLGAEIIDERDTVVDMKKMARKGGRKRPEK